MAATDPDTADPGGADPDSPRVFVARRRATAAETAAEWVGALASASEWAEERQKAVHEQRAAQQNPGYGRRMQRKLQTTLRELPSWHRDRPSVDFAERSLRFALAMRGGVSLAVWIGGAVAELDFVRGLRVFGDWNRSERRGEAFAVVVAWDHAEDPDVSVMARAQNYARLLARKGYHRIELDVLAGASAGGLNGVLSAAAQSAGTSVDSALNTWREAGGLHQLLRDEGFGEVESVLEGDRYFYVKVLERIRGFYTSPDDPAGSWFPHPGLVADQLSVDLSATVLNAQESWDPALREGHAGFRFATGVQGADVPSHSQDENARVQALQRLALAARTTSSFPGAFEPATIWSFGSVPDPGSSDPSDASPSLSGTEAKRHDMSGAFLAHRTTAAPGAFRVVDGGVFDNIPIERAFRAIRMRPALAPVHRALVYLDPAPPPAPAPEPPKAEEFGEFLSVVQKALGARRHESSREDRAEMEHFVRSRWTRQGRYDILAAVNPTRLDWADVQLGYVRSRGSADLTTLSETLENPESWQLEEDNLPRRTWKNQDTAEDTGGRRAEAGSDLSVWSRERVRKMDLHRRVNEATQQDPDSIHRIARDPVAAREAALWMLECVQWIEQVERLADDAPRSDPGLRRDLRERLYEILDESDSLARARLSRVVQALWVGRPEPEVRDEFWWPAVGDPELEQTWERLGEALRTLLKVLRPWHRIRGRRPATAAPAPAGGDAITAEVAPAGEDGATEVGYGADRWWYEAPWKHLGALVDENGGPAKAVPFVPALFSIIGAPEAREAPSYFSIDGEWRWGVPSSGPLCGATAILSRLHHEAVMQRILRDPHADLDYAVQLAKEISDRPGALRLPPSSRLAGAQLFNFGGFGSEQWRIGDWWWGRIDAAATLADWLGRDADGLPEPLAMADLVAQQFEADANGRGDPGAPGSEQLLTGRQGGLQRLRGSYRVSVLHRALRIAGRALYGAPGALKTVSIPLLHLLTPLLVLLPAVAQVPRLITALGFLLTGVVIGRAASPAADAVRDGLRWSDIDAPGIALVVASACVLALLIVGVAGNLARWSRLRSAVKGRVVDAVVNRAARRALWSSLLGALASVASIAAGAFAWFACDGVATLIYAIVAVVLAALSAFVLGKRVQVTLPKGARGVSLVASALAVLASLLALLAPVAVWAVRREMSDPDTGPVARMVDSGVIDWATAVEAVESPDWAAASVCGGLLLVGLTLCWGVVGLPRPRPHRALARAQSDPAPGASAFGRSGTPIARSGTGTGTGTGTSTSTSTSTGAVFESAGSWLFAWVIAFLAAGGAWLVLTLCASDSPPELWRWVLASLAWGNILWCVPMWVRLEAPAWRDDRIVKRGPPVERASR